tara:strand:+ start:2450 stop:2560 length:111 start_codon:yes stop_codon:yes gene_type:complete
MCNTSGYELVIDVLLDDLKDMKERLVEALEKLEALE